MEKKMTNRGKMLEILADFDEEILKYFVFKEGCIKSWRCGLSIECLQDIEKKMLPPFDLVVKRVKELTASKDAFFQPTEGDLLSLRNLYNHLISTDKYYEGDLEWWKELQSFLVARDRLGSKVDDLTGEVITGGKYEQYYGD